jgi:serine/threonine protein kinase
VSDVPSRLQCGVQSLVCACRILREISLFQQLRHPAILTPNRVIVETDNDGVLQGLFLSFELLGPSLREAVFQKDKPLPPQRVRAYMLDILGAMAYLHSKGIVRR